MDHGWYQVAFDRDLGPGLTPLSTAVPLVALRTRKGLRVFDAACPHRGADLGVVGNPDTDAILCGFHGKRIGLGTACEAGGYFIREHEVLAVSGLVFVRIGGRDNGFRALLNSLDRTHFFAEGYTMKARVAPELVVENGLDQSHFRSVHDIRNDPVLTIAPSESGELAVTGSFTMPASAWQQRGGEVGLVSVPYTARVFSGGVIVSALAGADPYVVITSATAGRDGATSIRLSVAVPAGAGGKAPEEALVDYLVRQTRTGLSKDIVIWESLIGDAAPAGDAADAVPRAFRRFLEDMKEEVPCSV